MMFFHAGLVGTVHVLPLQMSLSWTSRTYA